LAFETLRKPRDRIQARAYERCGELLQQIEPGQGTRDGKRQEGDLPPLNRTDAGPTEHERKTALRIASIPEGEREELIESDAPPTVTKLAELGGFSAPGCV
jgi:hypothetical protein